MSDQVTWLVALICLAVLAAALLWLPLARSGTFVEVNYNEGWNSYQARTAASGTPLYGSPPEFTITNYPPLSFHFIGWIGKLTGDFTAAGRIVSLISIALIALLIAALARCWTADWRLGAYAALGFITGLATLLPDRIGMNDPQLLATVFSVAGLYLYVRKSESAGWLCGSAAAFAIALFTKHNLLAFPAAVGAHLLFFGSRKRLGIWAGSLAAAAVLLLILTFAVDGPYFWRHLLVPRAYSLWDAWKYQSLYLVAFQVLFAAALLWSIRNFTAPERNVLAIAFVLAHLIGIGFAGGNGIDRNVFFDALITLAAIAAVAVGDWTPLLAGIKYRRVLFPVLLALPWLGILATLPAQMKDDLAALRALPQRESEFALAVDFLKSRPGPALCEDLLLCYEAGKPNLYEAFYVDDQIKIGRMREDAVVSLLESGQFRTIEIQLPANEVLGAYPRGRFTAGLMRALADHYRPALRTTEYVLLKPKDEP